MTTEEDILKLENAVKSAQLEHGPFPKTHDAIAGARKDLAWANKNIPAIKLYLQPKSSKPSSATTITGFTIFVLLLTCCANVFIF